jgi:hypothetical protein
MSDSSVIIKENGLPIVATIGNAGWVRAVDENGKSRLISLSDFKTLIGVFKKEPISFYFDALDTTTTDLWEHSHDSTYIWRGDDIKVTEIHIVQGTADTGGSQPTMNVKINGTTTVNASTMTLNASDNTWSTYAVSGTEANTIITDGDSVEFDYTKGTNGDNAKVFVNLEVQRYES